MLTIKVRGGTQQGNEHICKKCAYGHNRCTSGGEETFCYKVQRAVNGAVYECSAFYHKDLPRLDLMFKTAWILETSDEGKNFGFIPYAKWKKRGNDYGNDSLTSPVKTL